MKVPFINLERQHKPIQDELERVVKGVMEESRFVKGRSVSAFESEFASLLKTPHCISTGNGTDSLLLALKAVGVGPGDEVITPAFSWISSAETISMCGGYPVFTDVNPDSFCIDPGLIEEKVTPKTKAIIVVHLYGQAADISPIVKIAKRNRVSLIEDCAQAHLTSDQGKYVGTFGDAGCLSFYPTKNLGAFGDAGCVTTDNNAVAEKIRRLANHGALQKDDHLFEGVNSRMDTIQAAVLLAKLPHLKTWNLERQKNAELYNRLLTNIDGINIPYVRPNTEHTFHLYVIRAKNRDRLKDFLKSNGVETMIHYPKALPNLEAYKYLGHTPADFPVASQLQDDVLSLPNYPGITQEEIRYICEKIHDFHKKPHRLAR